MCNHQYLVAHSLSIYRCSCLIPILSQKIPLTALWILGKEKERGLLSPSASKLGIVLKPLLPISKVVFGVYLHHELFTFSSFHPLMVMPSATLQALLVPFFLSVNRLHLCPCPTAKVSALSHLYYLTGASLWHGSKYQWLSWWVYMWWWGTECGKVNVYASEKELGAVRSSISLSLPWHKDLGWCCCCKLRLLPGFFPPFLQCLLLEVRKWSKFSLQSFMSISIDAAGWAINNSQLFSLSAFPISSGF